MGVVSSDFLINLAFEIRPLKKLWVKFRVKCLILSDTVFLFCYYYYYSAVIISPLLPTSYFFLCF